MSSDPDQRLAELLARGPQPPEALDAARRQALLAEARQAWFRARAARQRWRWATALAACLVIGLGIWLAIATATTTVVAPLTVATGPERKTSELRDREERPSAALPPAVAPKPAPVMAPAPSGAPVFTPSPVKPAEPAVKDANPVAVAAAPAAAGAKPDTDRRDIAKTTPSALPPPGTAKATARRDLHEGAETPSGAPEVAIDADLPAAPAPTASVTIPANAPERGKLLVAAAVLHALHSGTLAESDREPALRAGLNLIASIRHPAADQLRRQLRAEISAANAKKADAADVAPGDR